MNSAADMEEVGWVPPDKGLLSHRFFRPPMMLKDQSRSNILKILALFSHPHL